VYVGTIDGSRVCVKRTLVYTKDGPEKATKVCHRRHRFPRLPSLTKLPELLPRSRGLEMLEAPEHRPLSGHHYHTLPARFELDAWRATSGVHR